MKKIRRSIFRDENILDEMLELRFQGHSSLVLAEKYGVDHVTILAICREEGVTIGGKRIVKPYKLKSKRKVKFNLKYEEDIPKAKTYKQILKESMGRDSILRHYCKIYGIKK